MKAESDPYSALQNVGIGLLKGMMMADNLVAAGLITPEAGCLFLLRLLVSIKLLLRKFYCKR